MPGCSQIALPARARRLSTLPPQITTKGADVRAVVFAGAGGNEVIRLEERPDPVPGSEELLVRVTHAGLNPADLSQREGSYPAPPGSPQDIPGLEVSGTVEACGAQVLGWKPGDRVFGLVGGGGLADRVLVHQRHVAAVPDALDEPGAAAVPEAFITAHDAIRSQAALARARRCSCTAPRAAWAAPPFRSASSCGARVLGTVRSADAAALVRELGGEPIDDEGFADSVLAATDGRGADVILELVGAPHFPDNLRAVAMLGRIVDRRPRRRRRGHARAAPADGAAREHARHDAARPAARAEGAGGARVRARGASASRERPPAARDRHASFPSSARARRSTAWRRAASAARCCCTSRERPAPAPDARADTARGPRAGAARPAHALACAPLRRARAQVGHDPLGRRRFARACSRARWTSSA